jgi:hypothetical protein
MLPRSLNISWTFPLLSSTYIFCWWFPIHLSGSSGPGGREHRQSFTPSRNNLHVHCSSRFLPRRVSNIQNDVDDYWRWCRHLAHLGYIWAEDSGNFGKPLKLIHGTAVWWSRIVPFQYLSSSILGEVKVENRYRFWHQFSCRFWHRFLIKNRCQNRCFPESV